MLSKYWTMWDGSLGEISTVTHRIHTDPTAKPVYQRPYRAGPRAREVEAAEVERMLRAGVIEPAQSEWSSPVVLVPKPDGSLRFCVDYRRLNAITIRDSYPLPRMDECIDSLGDAVIFTTLDCNSGYWQVAVAEEDRDKTTFTCHSGTYRYLRMPFGLMNAPASFQRTLDVLLHGFNWRTCLVYIDDVIIFSKSIEEHLSHVEAVLDTLHRAGVTLKLKKCEFFTDKVKYLGHIIRPGQLEINQAHTAALANMQHPTNQSELRSFMGLCNVYRRFIPNFSLMAGPLNSMLKKGHPVKFGPLTPEQAQAFRKLVDAVLSPTVLALPKPNLPYSVDTDASDYQLGAALFQTYPDGERRPVGFWSRTLNSAERNYSVSEKECLAVVWALQTLRPYLQGTFFVVHSDHSALRWLLEIAEPSGRLMRWRLRLSEFDFRVEYKKGCLNTQADALSRLQTLGETVPHIDHEIPCFLAESGLGQSLVHTRTGQADTIGAGLVQATQAACAHTVCQHDAELFSPEYDPVDDLLTIEAEPFIPDLAPIMPIELRRAQESDFELRSLRSRLERGVDNRLPYALDDDGLIYRSADGHKQLLIPRSLQPRVLQLSHYAKMAGHPGGRRLYHFLKRNFYWPSMSLDCYGVSRNCVQCARNRVRLRRGSKEMQLFPAQRPLECVAIDILGPLIKSERGYRFVLVITDRFSKLVRTVPMKKVSAFAVAQAFVREWVFTYGPPAFVLSDNGSQFKAKFFQNVCRILSVQNLFTTTYHPQTNGQAERFNRTILDGIRTFVGDHPRDWDIYTDVLTYSYNSMVHRMTKFTPFELVLSRPPQVIPMKRLEPPEEDDGSPVSFHAKWTHWLETIIQEAKAQLSKEQARYKKNFDSRLRLPKQEIRPGMYVFVRREKRTEEAPSHKLAPVAEGPYRVTDLGDGTVVIRTTNLAEERVSLDRVVQAPHPERAIAEAVVSTGPTHDRQSANNEVPGEPSPSVTPQDDDVVEENVIRTHGSTGKPVASRVEPQLPRLTPTAAAGYRHFDSESEPGGTIIVEVPPQVTPGPSPTDEIETYDEDYVLDRLVDHGIDADGQYWYQARWFDFGPEGDTWEPIEHLPRSAILRLHRVQNLVEPPDEVLARAFPG